MIRMGILIFAMLLAVVAVVALLTRRQTPRERAFDERQVAARGLAFRAAFFTLLLYDLLAGAAELIAGVRWAQNDFVFGCVGALLGLLVFIEVSVWNHAYLCKDGDTRQTIAIGAVGLGELLVFVSELLEGEHLIHNGRVQSTVLSLGMGIVLVCAAATLLLRRHIDRRDEAEDAPAQ